MASYKPYPLREKILQVLYKFQRADLKGIAGAVKEHYSIHTTRKYLKKMEDEGEIYSTRDENKCKIYGLTERGRKLAEKIKDEYYGLPKRNYLDVCLRWSNALGGKTEIDNLPILDIVAMNWDDKGRISVLMLEKEGESLKDFIRRVEKMAERDYIKKVYIVVMNKYRIKVLKKWIQDRKSEITIEIFECD